MCRASGAPGARRTGPSPRRAGLTSDAPPALRSDRRGIPRSADSGRDDGLCVERQSEARWGKAALRSAYLPCLPQAGAGKLRTTMRSSLSRVVMLDAFARKKAPSMCLRRTGDCTHRNEAVGRSARGDGGRYTRLQQARVGYARRPTRQSGYFPAFRRSFGTASQTISPLGGASRLSSSMATPAFFSAVM
jgi:hypothetical protein